MTETKTLTELATEHKLTVLAEFVPFSKSRNAKDKPKLDDLSLNWKVTLQKDGRNILTTDYQMGIGHCVKPEGWGGPFKTTYPSLDDDAEIRRQCETGKVAVGRARFTSKPLPPPKTEDVLSSLLLDAQVLGSDCYEDWADECGYDRDSCKGETVYRACLAIALKLRNGLGEPLLSILQDAARDY